MGRGPYERRDMDPEPMSDEDRREWEEWLDSFHNRPNQEKRTDDE